MRKVPNGGPPVGPLAVFVWVALAGPKPPPADVCWTASVPLWTSLSPAGKVVAAGPARWASPPPAARLGTPPMPQPRELPETLSAASAILPPGSPAPQLVISSPTVPALPPRPEGVSPPLVAQATQRRPIRPAGDDYAHARPFVPAPVRKPSPEPPAARLTLPIR
jgi:hypothetical protein